MSLIWTFSSSSQLLLKRCLDVATPPDAENKWVKKFKRNQEKSDETEEKIVLNNKNNATEVCNSDPEPPKSEKLDIKASETYDEFFEHLESETALKLDLLQEKCLENPTLITKLPEKLPSGAIEKICKLLFDKCDVDVTFLDMFYQNFFPVLVTRDHSWFSLDLLVKSEIAHPVAFGKLLQILLKDLGVPSKILQDFYQTLNDEKKTNFMKKIVETDFTAEEFLRNLFTIHMAYKNCNKNTHIQNSIQNFIIKYSDKCSNDKNFGKLLLAFLQEQKNILTCKDLDKLEKSIETHKTPFKKPCLNVFKEIVQKCKDMKT